MSDSTENKPKPSREQLEARVVAMLLGEASPFEEEQLRAQLKTDAALAKFCAGIEQTLPLLREALDVGQAAKAKSPKPRLSRKRRAKLKQLFRNAPGLAKRKVVRVSFRKAVAIAAAVCAVLLVAAGLLLPSLAKDKHRVASNSTAMPGESEEESRVADFGRVGGLKVADQKGVAARTAPSPESAPSASEEHPGVKVDYLADREGVVLYDESVEEAAPISAEVDRLAATTGVASVQELGSIAGNATDGRLALGEQREKSAPGQPKPVGGRGEGRGGNRPRAASKRKLAELALPALKTSDHAESLDAYGYGKFAGFGENADKEGGARASSKLKSNAIAESAGLIASLQKNLAQPRGGAVAGFESRYADEQSSPSAEPAETSNLYWYQNKSGGESGGQPAMAAGELATAATEFNFATPSPDDATTSGVGGFSKDSLRTVSEAKPSGAVESFQKTALPGPPVPPMPLAGDAGVAVNGRRDNSQFESANRAGAALNANAASGRQAELNWDIRQRGEAADRQWGVTRADVAGESDGTLALPGGPGGMGGMGMGGGMGGGGFAAGQPMGFGGIAASPVSGGAVAVPDTAFDADADGDAVAGGQLFGFDGGQAVQESAKPLGVKATRRYSGRTTLEPAGNETAVLGQALSLADANESLNGQVVRGFVSGKAAQSRDGLERDQSGAVASDMQTELNRAETGVTVRGVIAQGAALGDELEEESGQAEAPVFGDAPALGRLFKSSTESEKAARGLSANQAAHSADSKTRAGRGRASVESARRSLSLAKQDEEVLAGLREEEYESLTATIDESLLSPGTNRTQSLAEGDADKNPVSRQPESFARANRELLRRKGMAVGNKKLPASAKPKSASRSSRLSEAKREEKQLAEKLKETEPPAKPAAPSVVYTPRPETVTAENNFSTFSLNVSDVSFKTALASLQADKLPASADVRSEEFLNALEYRDPMPRAGEPLAFHWERARSPFGHDRDIIRFSVRTAALGRQPGRAVNLVCLLDNSGSMEREDRVSIVQQSLGVLARKLTPSDRVSLVTFSRTPQLRVDGMRGGDRAAFLKAATGWIPQGGTHVEDALALAYETAKKHFIPGGNNRVILLTDGAANMGNVKPYQLRKTVEANRKQGIALDCFGIGWEGYNDNLLEVLARNGDGRYGFLSQPAQAVAEFEQKLLGAFQVAASDVKVQVEWNADRVNVFRQVGYLRHQLKKEDFRNNKIDAAEISAAESGNALYVVQVDPNGEGPLGMVRVRYKEPFTSQYTEMEWSLAYESAAMPLEQASPAMRLGSVAATFAEWLARNPHAQGVQLADLQGLISGIPSIYATDPRPAQLEWMINKARILAGN
ncbi:MAG: von Willebrand factor type A domain-containing protein [Verrucomicrobiota bacterium]|nr:von Willebrand factor type A domain-containing protein [Verrucomicrobiota bacterium]